jgi:hypothetical protein
MRRVSSAYYANSTLRDAVGMPFTYRLKSTAETSPPLTTPARTTRPVDAAEWEDVGTFGSLGMMIRFSLGKMGSSRRLACRGGFWSIRCLRL